jgi:hypothetical protein
LQIQPRSTIALALLGSSIVVLIVTFVLAVFSVSGVLNMADAGTFLWIVYGVFIVTLMATAILNLQV